MTVFDPAPGMDSVICSDRDGLYCLPKAYEISMPNILFGNPAEELTKAVIAEQVTGSILHAGGYVGDFFPSLELALPPGAECLALEPVPLSHRAAQITLRLNGLCRTTCLPLALGAAVGEVEIQVQDDDGLPLAQTSRFVRDRSAGTGVWVRTETIDALSQGRDIQLIHLDLEGFEIHALAGATSVLTRPDIVVIIENYQERLVRTHLADFECLGEADNNFIFARRPSRPGLHSRLARARWTARRGDVSTSDDLIAALYDEAPGDSLVIEAMIDRLSRHGDERAALDLALTLRDREPWRLRVYEAVERARRAGVAPHDAHDVLCDGYRRTGSPNLLYHVINCVLETGGDPEPLVAEVDAGCARFPRHAELALGASRLHEARGDLQAACANMVRAVSLRPNRPAFAARLVRLQAGG